jgi:hypothetical protein
VIFEKMYDRETGGLDCLATQSDFRGRTADYLYLKGVDLTDVLHRASGQIRPPLGGCLDDELDARRRDAFRWVACGRPVNRSTEISLEQIAQLARRIAKLPSLNYPDLRRMVQHDLSAERIHAEQDHGNRVNRALHHSFIPPLQLTTLFCDQIGVVYSSDVRVRFVVCTALFAARQDCA